MPRTKLPSAWALLSACFADLLSGRNVSKFAGIRQKSVFRSSLPPWCGAFEGTIGQSEFRVKRNFFRLHWDVRSFPPNWSVESLHGAVLALPSLGSEHLNPFRVTNSGWPWWHWWILQILGWQAIKMFVFALTLQMMLSCYPHSRGDSFKSLVNSELSLLVLHLKRTCLVKDDTMQHHWKDGCRVPGARALRGSGALTPGGEGGPGGLVHREDWMWLMSLGDSSRDASCPDGCRRDQGASLSAGVLSVLEFWP